MKRLLLLLLIAASAFADHPAKERGFRADSLYQFTELDSINLYNGAVNVMLPIGQTYAVSSNLSYAFTLRYASNIWSEIEVCGGKEGDACRIRYTWRNDNAGFGWNLSFGTYEEPAVPVAPYWGKVITPDGSEHAFYPTLHEGETATAGVYYTRDNTYLRRKDVDATTRVIEFPNGVRHRYQLRSETNTWVLQYMYDVFSTLDAGGLPTSNYVRIDTTILFDGAIPYLSEWQVHDSIGRTHVVKFKRIAPVSQVAIDTIDLQAFAGVRALYDFGYNAISATTPLTDGTPRVISRPCHNTEDNTASLSVNMLRQLRLAKGNPALATEPFMAFTMDYDEGIAGDCSATSGVMTSMTLPTLGRYGWAFRAYNYASVAPFDEAVGVSRRFVYDRTGKLIQARHYDGDTTGVNVLRTMKIPGTATNETGATVDYKAVHYFDISDGLDVGLPFTTAVTDGTATVRYLSSETFDCNEASTTESCNATPERRAYVKYERDSCPVGTCTRDINRRVVSDRAQYTSDGARTADVNRSSYDGLGHYRTATTAGTFASGNVRTDMTNYNPAAGTYPGSFVPPAVGSKWLLETYTDKTSTEGLSSSTSQYCFNATTGALERVRTLAGATVGVNDLLSVFYYDTAGNVTGERYYGGDGQTIGTASLCTMTLPSSVPYRIGHTYQYGARKTSEYQTGSGASVGFKFADYDIDQSTGWIATSRDTAGFATRYEFDALGRLTWELPDTPAAPTLAGDGYTEYVYTPAAGPAGAKVGVNRRPNNSRTGTPLTRSEYEFDDVGRLWRERTLMPSGWNLRETGYDWAGRKAYVTETGADGATPPKTTYAYDLFGRPVTATPPDGASHAVTYVYSGVRQTTKTQKIKTSSAGESSVTTAEQYDRQGRLYRVSEPSRPDGGNATTTYGYNSQNKLVSVSIAGQEGTQSRSFSYDGRGFLVSETHPESGTVTYQYDARAHMTKRVDGGIDMRTLYDSAERPSMMYEAAGQVWKTFTYSNANTTDASGTNWSKGKLSQALRHNPFPEFGLDVTITEEYLYRGRNGRVSQRTTTSLDGTAFSQSLTYDDLGLVTSQTYPSCTATCTTSGITLSNTYTNGLLTSIPGYSSTIAYHPNGLVSSATLGTGSILWTQTIATDGMARPATIALTGAGAANWSSGQYLYDGAGNIKRIDLDAYVYDPVSRLTSTTITTGTSPNYQYSVQSQTFDSFGNIKSVNTNGVTRTMTLYGLTNRLSSITDGASTTSVTYDSRGNITSLDGMAFEYDALGMARKVSDPTRLWTYVYTPSDERIWAYDLNSNRSTWTVRGLDNKPLAEWVNDGTTGWSGPVNYIYRNGVLHGSYAAGRTPATMYYAVDHLGTPRKIVGAAGTTIGTHTYYAFGQEFTNPLQDTQRLKFTGHERDFCCDNTNDAIDFMHARQYSAWPGRFLSVDPTWSSADLGRPQSWNRYSYVQNNPVNRIDPDGRCSFAAVLFGAIGCGVEGLVKGGIQDYHDAKLAVSLMGKDATATENVMGGAVLTLIAAKYGTMFLGAESAAGGTEARAASSEIEGAIAGSIRDVNPTGSGTNCVNCAATVDNMLATGRSASALPSGAKSITTLGSDWQSMGSQGNVAATMSKAGNGARGIVYVGTGKPGSVGHVFNVVNQKGVVRFLDGQTGKAVQWAKEWTDVRLLQTN